MVNKAKTIIATEYYDGLGNRAAIRMKQNHTENYILMDYNNDQILYVSENGGCTVTDLKYDNNQIMFGLKTGPNGLAHMSSTRGALHFAKSNGLTYMGQTFVRGIKVDHWLSCLYWPEIMSNFTLDYYFTVQNWATPELYVQIPVRAEVKGIDTVMGSNNFHHIYEYIGFSQHIQDRDLAFQTPVGIICPGRKPIKTMPTPPNRVSYREEIVSPSVNRISYADVWYDYNRQLVRYDYRPVFPSTPYYTTGPVKQIHDYSTGVAYAIDKTLGNCSIVPIPKTSFDTKTEYLNSTAGVQTPMYLKLRSPRHWIYFGNTSSYEGQRTVRGQLCDVFVSNTTNFKLTGYRPFNSTFVYYFLSPLAIFYGRAAWFVSDLFRNHIVCFLMRRLINQIKDTWVSPGRSKAVPIRIEITTPLWVGYQASYEYYGASEDEFPEQTFDVSSCFDDNHQKHFRIDFPDIFKDKQLTNKSWVLRVISDKVREATHLPEISLQNTALHVDAHRLFFLGTLLNRPPAKAYFQTISTKLPQYNADTYRTLPDESACAAYCNSVTKCNSFQFCESNKWCGLSNEHQPNGVLVPAAQNNCTAFSRTVRQKIEEIDFDLAWNLLDKAVSSGEFKVKVTTKEQDVIILEASSLTRLAADGSVLSESKIGEHMVG